MHKIGKLRRNRATRYVKFFPLTSRMVYRVHSWRLRGGRASKTKIVSINESALSTLPLVLLSHNDTRILATTDVLVINQVTSFVAFLTNRKASVKRPKWRTVLKKGDTLTNYPHDCAEISLLCSILVKKCTKARAPFFTREDELCWTASCSSYNQFANITLLLGPERRVFGEAHSGILNHNAVCVFVKIAHFT